MRTLVMLMALGLGCRPKPLPGQEIPPGPSPDLDTKHLARVRAAQSHGALFLINKGPLQGHGQHNPCVSAKLSA